MTTEKQSISRHKSASTHPSVSSGRSFDIIPPEKVRPSASSRPVIVSTSPPVPDNTMRSDVDVPQLNLKHATNKLEPTKSPVAAAKPEEQGVMLADLVAKREKSEAAAGQAPDQDKPVAGIDEAPELTADGPVAKSQDTVEETQKADAEPAQTDSDSKEAEPAADSLEAVMKSGNQEGAAVQPQEHSDSLKEAMKNMDEKDGRPHHELYGGKPVIVVHKDHRMSAVMWVVWFVVCVGIALVIVDVLLDAGIITTNYVIPHTNFL